MRKIIDCFEAKQYDKVVKCSRHALSKHLNGCLTARSVYSGARPKVCQNCKDYDSEDK